MIQTYTLISDATGRIETGCAGNSLTEDEESFYAFIKGSLNKLERSPSQETIDAILRFSKTF